LPPELWTGVLAGGFALLGITVGAALTYLANRDARKATVRDQAHRHAIDTCSDFIGISFVFISRKHDVVSSLARLKLAHPTATRLGHLLDDDLLKTTVHPMVEQFYTTVVRAEATAPTDTAAKYIHQMGVVHAVLGGLMSEGMAGKLPTDWKQQADRCTAEHQEAANALIKHLRDFDAAATFRKPITFDASTQDRVDAPAPDVQH
jgi:hypothetical protein